MTPGEFSEDLLVQQTTVEYLQDELQWESVYAYNHEDFGVGSLLGRQSDREVVLRRYLEAALKELNPGLPHEAYENAIRLITDYSPGQSALATNREKHELLRNGVKVSYRRDYGGLEKKTLKVFNLDEPEKNHFLCVRELWVRGELYRRRADIVGFVNGIPLLFVELKNINRKKKKPNTE
jgi:type I restriction enzyme, R subunit